MKYYDFEKARAFIDANKEHISSASLGMDEDWFWTAETIFSNGEYSFDYFDRNARVAGITGSYLATPTLQIEYVDGRTEKYNCYCSDGEPQGEPLPRYMMGCISERIATERAMEKRKELPDA